nr:hypothetical protein [Forsythia suspensa tombusvirus]
MVIVDNVVPVAVESPPVTDSEGASDESSAGSDSDDDEEHLACRYRSAVYDWAMLTSTAQMWVELAGSHPHNAPNEAAMQRYDNVVRGMVHHMARLPTDGHQCQHHRSVRQIVERCFVSVGDHRVAVPSELVDWVAVYAIGRDQHMQECVVDAATDEGKNNAPAEPSENGSGGQGGAKPPTGLSSGSDPDTKQADEPKVPEGVPTSNFRLAQDVIEVKTHRRIRHANPYARTIIMEIKNRLGCPAPNAANLLAVRRMAINSMERHGVRPTHVRRTVELVVAGVFLPDEHDLRGAKILQSVSMGALREEVADAGPKSVWYNLMHPLRSRRVSRIPHA